MSYSLIELFSYSIFIPAIAGLVRLRVVDRAYFPFILLIWVGVVNEIVNTVVINRGLSNAINDNIYSLLEAVIILWLFRRLRLFEKKQAVFYALMGVMVMAWVIINLFIFSIRTFNSYFNAFYAFAVVLLSIHHISWLLVNGKKQLLQQSSFLLAIGFICFFICKMLVEIFWIYGLNASTEFRLGVYRLMTWVNLSVNLLFFMAILWIPKKQEYM